MIHTHICHVTHDTFATMATGVPVVETLGSGPRASSSAFYIGSQNIYNEPFGKQSCKWPARPPSSATLCSHCLQPMGDAQPIPVVLGFDVFSNTYHVSDMCCRAACALGVHAIRKSSSQLVAYQFMLFQNVFGMDVKHIRPALDPRTLSCFAGGFLDLRNPTHADIFYQSSESYRTHVFETPFLPHGIVIECLPTRTADTTAPQTEATAATDPVEMILAGKTRGLRRPTHRLASTVAKYTFSDSEPLLLNFLAQYAAKNDLQDLECSEEIRRIIRQKIGRHTSRTAASDDDDDDAEDDETMDSD